MDRRSTAARPAFRRRGLGHPRAKGRGLQPRSHSRPASRTGSIRSGGAPRPRSWCGISGGGSSGRSWAPGDCRSPRTTDRGSSPSPGPGPGRATRPVRIREDRRWFNRSTATRERWAADGSRGRESRSITSSRRHSHPFREFMTHFGPSPAAESTPREVRQFYPTCHECSLSRKSRALFRDGR